MSDRNVFDKGMFADIAPYWGERLRSFLTEKEQVERLIQAVHEHRPGAEAIAEPLYEKFGDDIKPPLIIRYIGYLILQVMRKHGYRVAERGVQTKPNRLFKRGAVYERDPRYSTNPSSGTRNHQSGPSRQGQDASEKLKGKYHATSYADATGEPQLLSILKDIDAGHPLDDMQLQWLREADLKGTLATYYERVFESSNDPWDLVKAGRYWREAHDPVRALAATEPLIKQAANKNGRLNAAILTTRGGAYRDQGDLATAESYANEARTFDPSSPRPLSLLGAIFFERGEPQTGAEFFRMAEELGAEPHMRDRTIRSALARARQRERQIAADFLVKMDRARYAWVTEYLKTLTA
ncbi:MAG: hypothetical protein M3R24_08130 [Chloroflexota bacterium]|nr:hypothetical protein [Chloroflexota bacterium]